MRTAIVTIPQLDVATSDAVFECLHAACPRAKLVCVDVVQDQRNMIEELLCRWVDEEGFDLVLTIGATLPGPGLQQIHCMPAAMTNILDRRIPGFSETMRAVAADVAPLALLDCGEAGIRARSLIVNLPAGAKIAPLFLDAIAEFIPPALQHIRCDADAPSIGAWTAQQEAAQSEIDAGSFPQSQHSSLNEGEFVDFLCRKDNP